MTSVYDRTTQDVGNVVSLDHLNVTIADQPLATVFYILGLGLTRDPYLTVGLNNMWLNAGRQQFHVPTSTAAQVVRGHVGMVVPDLDELEERLRSVESDLAGTAFSHSRSGASVSVTCPWGNRFSCVGPSDVLGGARFGVPYIEFSVPGGTASGIARFYETMLGAPATVGKGVATVQTGPVQSLVFREDAEEQRTYDGHHIAVYLTDFSSPHDSLAARGLVTEESNEFQYRFSKIVDLETGDLLYELEHEVRSVHHPMYQRPLVNRDPAVTTRNFTRGAGALNVG
ncbi:MAG: hypothetical protein V3S98_02190 [Dehalococcoidia bacterium]